MNEVLPDPTDGRVHFYRDATGRLLVSQLSVTYTSTRVWASLGWLDRDEFNVGFPGWMRDVSIRQLVTFPLTEVEIVDKEETK